MRRTLELLAAAGVSALLTIGWIVYVGRELGPAAYAEFSTALAFVYFFSIVLSPLPPAIARVAARRVARGGESGVPALRRGILRRLLAGGVVVAPLLTLAAFGLARGLRFASAAPLVFAFFTALAFSILSADRGFLQGLFRFRVYNASILFEPAVRLGVTILLFRTAPSPAGALAAYLISIVAGELLIVPFLARSTEPQVDARDEWNELRRLVLPMFILMLAAAVYQNVDMVAVKRWFAPVTAGQYGAALAIARMFGVIFTPLYVLIGPVLTHRHETGEPLVPVALRFVAGYAGLCLVALAVLSFWGAEIIALLFGAGFAAGGWIAPHLGLVSILMHTSLLLAQVFITLHDFTFLRYFIVAAVIQVAGLALFHETVPAVLLSLYAAQLALVIPLSHRLLRSGGLHD